LGQKKQWSPETTIKTGRYPKSLMSREIKNGKFMKLKMATQLAIIGVIIQLISNLIGLLAHREILGYFYHGYSIIIEIIGSALLLPFFITLFKSQK
jgi:hypothetical protein